jgi:hypothetical protein
MFVKRYLAVARRFEIGTLAEEKHLDCSLSFELAGAAAAVASGRKKALQARITLS